MLKNAVLKRRTLLKSQPPNKRARCNFDPGLILILVDFELVRFRSGWFRLGWILTRVDSDRVDFDRMDFERVPL